MKSDQEILKDVEISIDEGIITLKFFDYIITKEENERLSELVLEKMANIFKENTGNKFNLLIDLTSTSNAGGISSTVRKNYAKISDFSQLNKIVAVGTSIVFKTVATFIAKFTGKENKYKWFYNTTEALEWLKE